MNPFYAVAQEPHKIFMPNMTYGLHFNPKFFLCLPSAYQNKKATIRKEKEIYRFPESTVITKMVHLSLLYPYKLFKSFFTATSVPLISLPL